MLIANLCNEKLSFVSSKSKLKIMGHSQIQTIPQPFTNLQLELLRLYARKITEQDLLQIKTMLAQYFMDKASDLADKVWDEKGLTEEKILGQHLRTPYRKDAQ